MEKVTRYPSRDLPQVYWHLKDCAARCGCELHRLAGQPIPGTPRGASFDILETATQHCIGQIRVLENQFGALITVTDVLREPDPPSPAEGEQAISLGDFADHLLACMALPPERRARRWPR